MKLGKQLPDKGQKNISNLEKLRKQQGLTQQNVADMIGCTAKTYRGYEQGKVLPYINHLIALADYYNVSTDYLLGRSNCKSVSNEYINRKTGLNDDAIQGLQGILLQDKNENSIGVVPSDLFQKMINNEQLTSDECDQIINCEQVYKSNNRPTLMQLLNFMLSNGGMEHLLFAFRNFINPCYNVPVYFDNDKHTFVFPDNDYSKLQGVSIGGSRTNNLYWLNLARSENTPNDNMPVLLNDTFFETVALKDIEKQVYTLRDIYNADSEK